MTCFIADSSDSGFVCEPDEYARLVDELKTSGIIKDHRSGLKTHKKSFTGKDFVDWVGKTKGLGKEIKSHDSSTVIAIYFICCLQKFSVPNYFKWQSLNNIV